MIIDAHQHFWTLGRGDYRFPAPSDPVLYRDFQPDDLAGHLRTTGVAQTILVQATDTIAETAFLLAQASSTPFVAGVVGWWDPREPDCLEQLLRLPHRERLVGVRPMLQRHQEIDWLLDPLATAEIDRMAGLGLVFEALVDARHLQTLVRLCRRHQDLLVVVNHFAKPWRHPELFGEWQSNMRQLAEMPNCSVKISGYPFLSGSRDQFADLVVNLRHLFGDDRLLWGSDWPVAEREGGYEAVLRTAAAALPPSTHRLIFCENAVRIYKIGGREA